MRRSFLVSLLYSFEAASNIEMKFDKARFVGWLSENMEIIAGSELNRCDELRCGWVEGIGGQIVTLSGDLAIILSIDLSVRDAEVRFKPESIH